MFFSSNVRQRVAKRKVANKWIVKYLLFNAKYVSLSCLPPSFRQDKGKLRKQFLPVINKHLIKRRWKRHADRKTNEVPPTEVRRGDKTANVLTRELKPFCCMTASSLPVRESRPRKTPPRVVVREKFKSRIRGERPNSWRPLRRADEEIRRGSSESSPGGSLMGKCDVMRVTEWLIEWGASQERRSVACHTSEFPQREREITTIVGRVPIIVARYDCQCGKLCDRTMPNPGRYMCVDKTEPPGSPAAATFLPIINNPLTVLDASICRDAR